MSARNIIRDNERDLSVDWQVAPATYQIHADDEYRIKYRQEVESRINSVALKSLKKMSIVMISTNVLCADVKSSARDKEPEERDLYLPLEICLTKSCVSESNKAKNERVIKVASWIINPGKPLETCVCAAMDHKQMHKIEYEKFRPNDPFIVTDLRQVVKDINAFLTADRTVYSREIRHCRQDIGCLKWLNDRVKRKYGLTMKPVKVLSVEDLYVVLLRKLYPRQIETISLGIAQLKFLEADYYDPEFQCKYHQARLREDEAATENCAMGVATCEMHVLLDQIFNYKILEEDDAAVKAATGH